jgi:GNAT superfamily N-acetyltransferase
LQRVYLDCYQLPPEAGPPFAAGLLERAGREGFRCCAARNDEDGAIIGFAYGFTGLPGQSWTDAMRAAVGPNVAGEWLDRHFEFAEFGVLPTWQGRGIGGRSSPDCASGARS